MMTVSKVISGVLALLLGLTAQTMAMARGSTDVADKMVLCIGASAVVVYVDAEGQPTGPPHFCPDCIVLGQDAPASPFVSFSAAVTDLLMARTGSAQVLASLRPQLAQPRAPPFSV